VRPARRRWRPVDAQKDVDEYLKWAGKGPAALKAAETATVMKDLTKAGDMAAVRALDRADSALRFKLGVPTG